MVLFFMVVSRFRRTAPFANHAFAFCGENVISFASMFNRVLDRWDQNVCEILGSVCHEWEGGRNDLFRPGIL